jgi:hypothetical protein
MIEIHFLEYKFKSSLFHLWGTKRKEKRRKTSQRPEPPYPSGFPKPRLPSVIPF